MIKNKALLLEEVMKYKGESNLLFSMPGNKGGEAFNRDDIGRKFANKMGYLDITEVEPLDNLHNPEGVIKDAQEMLRSYYGSQKAFFLVNGSTSGNLAAIFSAFEEGDVVLVERNCHKSIYNALILRKLKVTFIEVAIDDENEIFLSPNREEIKNAVKKCKELKGIILTYPNYFGITYDISDELVKWKREGIKIIIDGAHGAHFNTTEKLPKSLSTVADYIVLSAHKTLPALTGGAYLLVNCNDRDIEFYISSFTTTSPSYLIMSSLDYARYYLEEYGEEDYSKLIELSAVWRGKINSLKKVYIIGRDFLKKGYDIDTTRYVIVLPKGYSGSKLLD